MMWNIQCNIHTHTDACFRAGDANLQEFPRASNATVLKTAVNQVWFSLGGGRYANMSRLALTSLRVCVYLCDIKQAGKDGEARK